MTILNDGEKSEKYLYDPKADVELLTTEQAAEYLGYSYPYMRNIVSAGGLKWWRQAGQTSLFRKSDLDVYKVSRNRNATPEDKAKLESLPLKMEAKLRIDQGFGSALPQYEELKDFEWANIPKIHARLKERYNKDVPFILEVRMPDGGAWQTEYQPETWLEAKVKDFFKKRGKK